jgi:hypothetical protein
VASFGFPGFVLVFEFCVLVDVVLHPSILQLVDLPSSPLATSLAPLQVLRWTRSKSFYTFDDVASVGALVGADQQDIHEVTQGRRSFGYVG